MEYVESRGMFIKDREARDVETARIIADGHGPLKRGLATLYNDAFLLYSRILAICGLGGGTDHKSIRIERNHAFH